MNVKAWQRRLSEADSRLREAPRALEQRVGLEAVAKAPPKTSAVVTRTPSGASVAFSGPHAGAAAQNTKARVKAAEVLRGLAREAL